MKFASLSCRLLRNLSTFSVFALCVVGQGCASFPKKDRIVASDNDDWFFYSVFDAEECKKAREELDTQLLKLDANGFPMCRNDRGPVLPLEDDETPTYLAAAYQLFAMGHDNVEGTTLGKHLATALMASYGQFGEPKVMFNRHICKVENLQKQIVSCAFRLTWYSPLADKKPESSYTFEYQAKRLSREKYEIDVKSIKLDAGEE